MSALTAELADFFRSSNDAFTSLRAFCTELVPSAATLIVESDWSEVFNDSRLVHTASESEAAADDEPVSEELLSELLEQAPSSTVAARRVATSTATGLRGRIMRVL